MQISRVTVKNYRSLKDVTLDVDDYSVLVGANGAGKSSILYALDWFFNGKPLVASDVCGYKEELTPPEECVVEVSVTFSSLTANDRLRLAQYGRGDTATFRRTWALNQKDKVIGNALQGPGFAQLRGYTKVGDFRRAYATLRESLTDLPDLGTSPSKDAVHEALAVWESDSSRTSQLVEIRNDDASHMFGINGPNVIRECVRFVLVPAATDISSQVGESGKGSALNELIGAVMSDAGARAQTEWLIENEAAISELNSRVKRSVETSTGVQTTRINARLTSLVPNASIALTTRVPDWTPKTDASVTTAVTIDGVTNDVSKQGHGIQRAVMISMFQALVPDAELARGSHTREADEDEAHANERLELELAKLPSLIIGVEEPEIYQHPIRARAFARTLTALSAQPGAQVILATHSPYFVRPEQFSSLRRFTLINGQTTVSATSANEVSSATGIPADKIAKIVDKRVPTEFSEGFFADAVALVEGDTDRAVVEALASKLNLALDARGISVVEVSSKESLRIPYEILRALQIPVFVYADGDFLGAKRKHPSDTAKESLVHGSHRASTEMISTWLPASTAVQGVLPVTFGGLTVVASHYVLWHDDLEEELANWPSFVSALLANGDGDVRSRTKKDLFAYRSAIIDADSGDLPANLKSAIEVLASFS
ncbi:AAA family ATPase [Salinibacterium sp. TMP30]|uniref:ATP-dependent nuclease n=1 Tax=Salinibacterium sp. TMP30 TaxID=3138237 RepID=UPI0031399255